MTFLDTSFLYALFNPQDEDHERVREVFDSYRGRPLHELLVTTPHIIFETLTVIRRATRHSAPRDPLLRHQQALYAGERLLGGKLARIYRPNAADERAALEYFKKYKDQEYSGVDCLSFVVMEKLGIREALAVDSEFTHRFIARPGPRPK